jgi:integrase
VNKHILPYFEKLKLYIDEVTPKHIRDYYEYKFKSGRLDGKPGGLDIQSIRKHSMVLKQVFTEALIAEQITRNPASAVPLPKQEKHEIKGVFLTGDEANRLLQAFSGHQLQAMVYVTLYYGLRRSEALGLRWQSVDFEENTITIEHTVVKNLTVEYKDKTKTKTSAGTFPLLEDVKEVLLTLKAQQAENRKTFGNTYHESDYVFVWKNGNLYKPDYITRSFINLLKKKELPHMRFHDLRHSTASVLHDKGWDLKDIQDWLRHADIETTGNIYTHISEQRKQASAKDLEKTFIM